MADGHRRSMLLVLALATLPPAEARAASDADSFFCAQVYDEVRTVFDAAGQGADADEAQMRGFKLTRANTELALEHPERLLAARESADKRLALLPAPGPDRERELVDAYYYCGDLDGSNARDELPQRVAYQQFCRVILNSFLDRAPQASIAGDQERLGQMRAIVQALDAPAIRDVPLDRATDARVAALTLQHGDRIENAPSRERAVAEEATACHRAGMNGELGIKVAAIPPSPPPVAAPVAPAAPAASPRADLGPVFRMREVSPGGNYDGTWTRRGTSNVYDARWVFVPNGQVITDVLEISGVEKGELVIRRHGIKPLYGYDGIYRAPVRADGSLGPGTATWVKDPNYHWEPADPAFRLAAATAPADAASSKDADALYCKAVFTEAQAMFTLAGSTADANYAMERGMALVYFESQLQESNPTGYAAARRDADARIAALPSGPGRGAPLRAAYETCKGDKPPSAIARQAAEQRFCAGLLHNVTAPLRDAPASLNEKVTEMMKEFAAVAAALNAPKVVFRTDMTPKDDLDAAAIEQRMNADLDARLGKADHDEVLGDAVLDCYEWYEGGRLGGADGR